MEKELTIRYAEETDISTIRVLAQQTWPAAYGHILPGGQIDYMLNLFYSPESLSDQMNRQQHRFLIALQDAEPLGFASYSHIADGVYKLHKLYVLPGTQGMGLGKKLLEFVKEELKPLGAVALRLGVNRFNRALQFYQKLGFYKIKEEKTDIGNGFVMDDYIMETTL